MSSESSRNTLFSCFKRRKKLETDEVVVLTNETFDQWVQQNPLSLVKFYSPECKNCQEMEYEYQLAAQECKELDIKFAEVNVEEEKELAKLFEVAFLPLVLEINNDDVSIYQGRYTCHSLCDHLLTNYDHHHRLRAVEWEIIQDFEVEEAALNNITFLEEKNFLDHMTSKTVVMVMFYRSGDEQCEIVAEEYRKAGQKLEDYADISLAQVNVDISRRIYWSLDEPSIPHLVLYRGNCQGVEYTGKRDSEEMAKYMMRVYSEERIKAAKEAVVALTEETFDNFLRKNPLTMVKFYKPSSKECQEMTSWYQMAALRIKDECYEIRLVEVNIEEEKGLKRKYDVKDVPHLLIFHEHGKSVYEGVRKEDEIVKFMLEYKAEAEKITPIKFSDHNVCKEDDEDGEPGVLQLQATEFLDRVKDESKDILIQFYAPFCGHCKEFEPTYTELASKNYPNLTIARFESSTQPVHKSYPIVSYPAIYFVVSGRKWDPILYTGDRSIEDLTRFMRKHAVVSFRDSYAAKLIDFFT